MNMNINYIFYVVDTVNTNSEYHMISDGQNISQKEIVVEKGS